MPERKFYKKMQNRRYLLDIASTGMSRTHIVNSLCSAGMPFSTASDRLALRGFADWELEGIISLVRPFLDGCGLKEVPVDAQLWPLLHSRKEALKAYMHCHGMSFNTTLCRFREWNWKEWELQGIDKIIFPCADRN